MQWFNQCKDGCIAPLGKCCGIDKPLQDRAAFLPMILTVGSTKGGVGKSTLAVQLAITWASAGRDVLLVDGDKQGSVQKFIAFRAEAERRPPLVCVQYADGRVLRDQVRLQVGKYDDVVIDAGGHDSTTQRAALLLSDAVLVPFLPRTVDVLALADMAALIDEARAVRDGLLALAVLNIADPGVSTDNTDAISALTDLPQLVGLKAQITRRKAFPNAAGFGLSVEELTSPDPKACAELAALVREVSAMVEQRVSNAR
jgi:chromosome partitioning protein